MQLKADLIEYAQWLTQECHKPNADPNAIYEIAKLKLADIRRRYEDAS